MKIPTNIMVVGIDPAKQVHQGVAIAYPEVILLSYRFENSYEAISSFDEKVMKIAKKNSLKVIYGLEDSGVYGRTIKEVLTSRNREIREVNPLKTNRQKDFYGGDKSDEIDARCIAQILLRSYENLPKIEEDNQVYASIREAERFRDTLVKTKTREVNRLHFYLTKTWGGLYKKFFSKLQNKIALVFFGSYPMPQILKKTEVKELSKFLYEASSHRMGGRDPKQLAYEKAKFILSSIKIIKDLPLSPEKEMKVEIIRQLVANISQVKDSIKIIEKKLDKDLLPQTGQSLTSLKSISTATASVLLGETLNPDRFSTRDKFARYNGSAPKEMSSGGKIKHRARKGCNHRLKKTIRQISVTAIVREPLTKNYYQGCLSRDLSKSQALKRVDRKISDIVYKMMKTKQPYNREFAIKNIMRRRQKTDNLGRARWQSRNLRIKEFSDEIESLVLPSVDILAELRKIEREEKKKSVNKK
ncbi:MAG: IS110 family transposase, partial [Candidatus Aerophobetes bacterium]|nr:IS110 family transposase [Candidatus Aerophobetes bacterium]